MMTADDVFREFASEIRKVTPWPDGSNKETERTRAVMRALHTVTQSLLPEADTRVYYKGCKGSQEFMLDFCCMDGKFHEMLLGAESEWIEKDGEVEYDFQKLVYTRARVKMMIFGWDEPSELEKMKTFLEKYPCNMPGDTYIFAHISWQGAVKGRKLTIDLNRHIEESIYPDH